MGWLGFSEVAVNVYGVPIWIYTSWHDLGGQVDSWLFERTLRCITWAGWHGRPRSDKETWHLLLQRVQKV
jgi:hypothetical protein